MAQLPVCKVPIIFLITYVSTFKIYSQEVFTLEHVTKYLANNNST